MSSFASDTSQWEHIWFGGTNEGGAKGPTEAPGVDSKVKHIMRVEVISPPGHCWYDYV